MVGILVTASRVVSWVLQFSLSSLFSALISSFSRDFISSSGEGVAGIVQQNFAEKSLLVFKTH